MADQPLIDISPENWRIVRDILQRHVPDREVWAFGSRAKWTAKEFSDLDIAIIGDKPLSLAVMAELSESFQDSALPFKVDIVDWAAITPAFRKVIETSRVELFVGQKLSSWAKTTLGNLLSFANGKTSPDREDNGKYEVFGSNGPIGRANISNAPDNAIVIGRVGSYCGSLHFSPVASWVTDNAICATAKEGNNPRFLLYLLQTLNLNNWRSGSGQPLLNQSILSSIPTAVPKLPQQNEIASLLGSFDDRIALLQDTNVTLEAIAQALFKSWFVDFDPVRAKAEGREPEGVPPEVAELFPSEFEESDLGEIPKGWTVEPFGKLLEHAIGGDWGKDEVDVEHSATVAIIRGTDIPDIRVGNLDGVPRRYVSPKKLKSRRLQDGDIVIEISGGSKTQATGRSLYCTDSLLDGFVTPVVPASFCRLFRPADKYLGILLAIHLSSIYAAGKMWNYQVQSTGLANFQTTHFLESELVVVPSEPIRETFFDLVRPLIERQQTASIRTTASLRDALLPRLMSGQLNPVEADS